ncbi:MAG: MFS transporter [Candidatus Rokubacteria bacterium]|nr:MFS transporter [Candidatus Rokubacteria bacterium]
MARLDATALLCLMGFGQTFGLGAFAPLLPEIGRAEGLADWQLGLLAGSFGLARMISAIPAGVVAGRHLALTIGAGSVLLPLGMLVLASGGPFPVLLLGRVLMGLGVTLATVGGLTALLQDRRQRSASLRLNMFEFAAMLGVLGGLAVTALVPEAWGWQLSYILASSPLFLVLVFLPALWRVFPAPLPGGEPDGPGLRHRAEMPVGPRRMPGVVVLMFVVGPLLALSWSAVSQFLLPLRGTREFGLDRAGVSWLLALGQLVDLVVLLPVGRAADVLGLVPVLGAIMLVLGVGTAAIGLGSFGWFVAGCIGFGVGMAGWMLPLGILRAHLPVARLAWWMGVYRVGVDGATLLGPLASGVLGERSAGWFVGAVGAVAAAVGAALLGRRPFR